MAPTVQVARVLERAICPSGYTFRSNACYRNSSWHFWGRWVFAGVAILFIIAVIVLLGCRNSRRRKNRGLAPRYGTGWMAPGPKYPQQNNPGGYGPPPPQYTAGPPQDQYPPPPNPYGQQYNNNQGYYSGQQEGLQPPQNAYYPQQGRDNVYEPPSGPPPGK